MQYFKGDELELKFEASGKPILDSLSAQKSMFFSDAYVCFKLGELLYDMARAPLANAIARDIFRESFSTIFESFSVAGSFESYLTVFRNIFGEDVDVQFTVPGPGKLQIDIIAAGVQISDLVARSIVNNAYVFDEVIDYDEDNIVVQGIKGFQSQYELEQMLYEMVPDGIYTIITLTIGEG